MRNEPSITYIGATIVAAMLAIAGVWLPWVRKRPVGYADGQPYYTSEFVSGLESGLRGIDPVVVLLVLGVVGVVVLARQRDWHPDVVLVAAGGLMVLVFGNIFRDYRTVERYAIEPGLYLLIASGFLLILLGAGAIFKRRFTTFAEGDSVDPPTG
ncbi:hypothetical protein [Haladaptatus sp. NG-SE-30]